MCKTVPLGPGLKNNVLKMSMKLAPLIKHRALQTYLFSVSSFSSFWFLRLWWQVRVMTTMSMRISSPPATAPTMIISMFSMIWDRGSPSVQWRVWISAFFFFFGSVCYSGQSKCGTLTALSSTCHADLHLRVPLPHVILRHALVGASVGQAKGSSKIQRAVGVGDDSLRQLTTGSGSRKKTGQSFITANSSCFKTAVCSPSSSKVGFDGH